MRAISGCESEIWRRATEFSFLVDRWNWLVCEGLGVWDSEWNIGVSILGVGSEGAGGEVQGSFRVRSALYFGV